MKYRSNEGVPKPVVERPQAQRIDVAVHTAVLVDDLVPDDVGLSAPVRLDVVDVAVGHHQVTDLRYIDAPRRHSLVVDPERHLVVRVVPRKTLDIRAVLVRQWAADPHEV